jgi:hypothetical protein
MAVIEGITSNQGMDVDPSFKAGRVALRPMECVGWLDVGARSGALTGAAANTAVFSFRNLSANPIVVRRVGIGFICTTGFTAAQELGFGLMVARAFNASDSGGTAIALTGNNCKVRTALATPTSVDCRISSTGALTAGTKTLDANHLAVVGCFAAATTAGALLSPQPNNLLSHDAGDYPLVLGQNEGFNIMNLVAMGAAGVGTLYVNVELAEASSY